MHTQNPETVPISRLCTRFTLAKFLDFVNYSVTHLLETTIGKVCVT